MKYSALHVDFFITDARVNKIVISEKSTGKGLSWRVDAQELADPIDRWMQAYARREPISEQLVPLALLSTTPFVKKVWMAIAAIPFGETRSYSDIAKLIGHPQASRAVGTACGKNPYPLVIPCHRVISSDGSLGGFASCLKIKQALLDFEQAWCKKAM